MFQKTLSHPYTHILIGSAVAGGVLVCVFPQLLPKLSWVVNYAVQLMLVYLFAGLVFLALKQPRLTFILFTGCLALSFFLKYSVNNDSIERWRQTVIKRYTPAPQVETELKIAHLNLSNSKDVSSTIAALRSSDADLLSIHEVTPNWDQWLKDSLSDLYPNHHTLVDLGLFGMAIYSKLPLGQIDTFYYQEIPNLRGFFEKENKTYCFFSVHTEPALNTFSLKRLQEHLGQVAYEARKIESPLIVLGEFNAVSWSSEIRMFMDSAGLSESRTGFLQETSSFWDVPLDHIFFSHKLQCLDFRSFKGSASQHLGIMGIYQLKSLTHHAKKTAQ